MMMFPDSMITAEWRLPDYCNRESKERGFGAFSNGVYWQPKRGHDPLDMRIENKSSLANFSWEFSNNMATDKL